MWQACPRSRRPRASKAACCSAPPQTRLVTARATVSGDEHPADRLEAGNGNRTSLNCDEGARASVSDRASSGMD